MKHPHLKRVYEAPAATDGFRILVDRLWPRGLTKEEVRADAWLKDVGPSDELRHWFGHDPARWDAFRERYVAELKAGPALEELRKLVTQHRVVTLVFAAKDEAHNNAEVLREVLTGTLAA